MNRTLGRKILTSIALVAIIAQSFSPYVAILPQKAYAQEVTQDETSISPTPTDVPTLASDQTSLTPTPTETPVPTDTVTPTPTDVPTDTVTPTPTQVDNLSPPTNNPSASLGQAQGDSIPATSTPTLTTPSKWTFEKVELNKEYIAPQNSEVKLTFTKLPDPSGNIKIEEITLTKEQIAQTGSLSDKAYDITSDMANGSFSYNLSLPIPDSAKGKAVGVKSTEDLASIASAAKVENTLTKTDTSVSINSLNHFTIFVVVNPTPTGALCVSAGATTVIGCYSTIQAAIDAAAPTGDTIKVYPGAYNQDEANLRNQLGGGVGSENFNIFVDKSVTIQGVDASGVPITDYNNVAAFIIPKSTTSSGGNISTIFIQADNVTITGLDIASRDIESYDFKTISIIGNNTTIKYSKVHSLDQVSDIYMYDPNYDGSTNVSHIQSYRFEGNYFDAGAPYPNDSDAPYASGIRFSSGAGWTGDVANRVITGNTFNLGRQGILFVGPGRRLWDQYPVGAATIINNTFTNQKRASIEAEGKYGEDVGYGSIDWNGILSGNTFDRAVIVKTSGGQVRSYQAPAVDLFGIIYNIRGIYSTIQSYPIDKVAQSGDTINVAAGTYTEIGQIVIDKNLSIVGADKTTTIIKPANDTGNTGSGDNRAWLLSKPDITFNISGVTLDGANKNICFGIYDYSLGTIQDVNVKNISCEKYYGRAIYLKNNATIRNVILENIGRIGVFVWQGATAAIIDKLTYIGKGAGDYLDYGIEVEGGSVAITDSIISNVLGISATPDNSDSAAFLATTTYGPSNASISGLTITNSSNGIAVGYDSSDKSTVTVHNSNLSGALLGVVSTAPLVDATNNWWGDASGPKDTVSGDNSILDTNPNGIGSAAIGAVKYSPWFTNSAMTTLSSANPITKAATGITLTGATVNGTNGDYVAGNTSFWWGTASAAGSFTAAVDPSGQLPSGWSYNPTGTGAKSAGGSFSEPLTGLTPGTTYHFVAWSLVGGTWYPGAVLSFTTTEPAPTTVKVTIDKYVNGVQATAANTNSASFPMHAIYPGGEGPYALSTTGFNNPDSYKATTSDMPLGSNYSTYETPASSCTAGYPFSLVGYSTGTTLANAVAATVTTTVPNFTNLTSDKFIIVWNKTCPPVPVHLSPADNSTLTTAVLDKIDWTDVTDSSLPITYIYQASNSSGTNLDGSFATPVYTSGTLTNSEIPTVGTPEGVYYWHIRAVDSVGNTSAWSTPWKVTVDNTAPTVDLVFPTPGPSATSFKAVFSENVNPTEAANPANYFLHNWPGAGGSGVLTGNATVVYDSGLRTATITFVYGDWYISPEQQWGVQNVHDLAGNLQQVSPYSEYSTPLVAPVTVDSGTDSNWHNTSVTVTLSCTDVNGSGCRNTYYTTDGSTPTTSSFSGNSVTLNTDGIYTIRYFSVDNAGNVESIKTAANQVKIDKTGPTLPTATPGAGDYNSDQFVTLISTDSASGLDKIFYTIDGSTPDKTKTEYTGVTINVDHDMTIKAIAYDNAGNASGILSATYGVPPIISSENNISATSTTATITWATDDLSTSRVIYDINLHATATPTLDSPFDKYGYANTTAEFDTGVGKTTSHSVNITGLTAGTIYYYRVISHGSPEAVGKEKSFATTSPATKTTSSAANVGGAGDGRSDGLSSCPSCTQAPQGNLGGGGNVLGASITPAQGSALLASAPLQQAVLGSATSSAKPTVNPSVSPATPTLLGKNPVSSSTIWVLTHKKISLLILLVLAGLGYYLYRKRKKKQNS